MLLNIEKLIYGGDGLARLPTDARGRGKAVFVPFVLAGEKIEAAITEEKSSFARAQATAILELSPHRTPPPCPYFTRCGGCHYQHATYDHQLDIKREILRENLRRIAKLELQFEIQTHPSPPWNYRNRSRLQVRTHPEFTLGYFKFASHEVLPVEECPISSPLINRGIAALWQAGRAGRTVEGIREIEFFAAPDADGNETHLLLELVCDPEARRASVRAWAEEFCAAVPEIVGIVAFREPQKGVQEPLVAVGASELTYHTKTAAYRVSAGSFFQTNRFLIDELTEIVASGRSGDLVLDLYAGVGLFSTALASNIRHIVSVEMSQTAAADLKYNLSSNGKAVQIAADLYLANLVAGAGTGDALASLRAGSPVHSPGNEAKGRVGNGSVLPHSHHHPDLVIVDPPRSGLGDGVARSLVSLHAPRITYVSCDPATLARDLVPLQAAGYRVEEVHLVDLFPQTYHLESIVQLLL
ncbi:MAG TPA: class I SAM-dependent RNA methyltransferase [Candidatus Acidoferrum sp.]|nr:class I SAM-dependent RNA methyltransferase [Candidatus Acidoferrum sp.]